MPTKDNDDKISVKQADVDRLRTARAQVKKWQAVEKAAKEAIVASLCGRSTGTVRGEVVVTNNTTKSNRLDVTALRKNEPEIAAIYTVPSEVTTMRLVEIADTDDGGDE